MGYREIYYYVHIYKLGSSLQMGGRNKDWRNWDGGKGEAHFKKSNTLAKNVWGKRAPAPNVFFTLSYRSKMNPAIKYTRSGNKNRFFLLTGQQGPKYSKKAISRRKR